MKKKELQEWLYDEGLSDCPFCGETAQRRDESGRIRWETVRINHTIKRSGWAEILPEDQQYRESYAVCCGNCGGSGGHYASIEWAVEAWNRRGIDPEEQEKRKRAKEYLREWLSKNEKGDLEG